MAKEFKTSRAPIREALRQLENEGLVEYVRNAGCSVKEISLEESFEIYLMRANYEIMAVRLLQGNIPQETIDQMEIVLEKMKNVDEDHYDQLFSYDNEFHSHLIKMTEWADFIQSLEEPELWQYCYRIQLTSDKEAVIERQYPDS